jgi:hypothetical protein
MKLNLKSTFFAILFIFLFFFGGCKGVLDVKLHEDSNLYVGKGEVCQNSYIKVSCQEGLKCKNVSDDTPEIKVCYPEDEKIPQDYQYKEFNESEINNN